jgi:WAP-type (Whey Acidic Protein) 'four-disulfide core'
VSKSAVCIVAAAVAIACNAEPTARETLAPTAPIASATMDASPAALATAVEASAPPVDAAVSATAVPSAVASAAPRKRAGTSCSRDRECAAGLGCCQTGFRGHCGGAYMPDQPQEPCVMLSTCAPAPCRPMDLPP